MSQIVEKARSRGKIPRAEWAAIAARHATGETLASIARDYNCTAPAIRYIVRQEAALAGGRQVVSVEMPASDAPSSRELDPLASPVSGFDARLRNAMTVEISAFLVALDDVGVQGTSETYNRLREATDRLLRAAARIRIGLEEAPMVERSKRNGPSARHETLGSSSRSRR